MESATNILPVMRGAGIEPSPDTYVSLLNAYAEKGDLESMKKVCAIKATMMTINITRQHLPDSFLLSLISDSGGS